VKPDAPYNRGETCLSETCAIAPSRAPPPGVALPDTDTLRVPGARPPVPRRALTQRITTMAKGQKKSNKEIRKPKADKSKAKGASPTLKDDAMLGVEKKKR